MIKIIEMTNIIDKAIKSELKNRITVYLHKGKDKSARIINHNTFRYLILLKLLLFQSNLNAQKKQKPSLTLESYKAWTYIGNGGFTKDNKYLYYTIKNMPAGENTFVFRPINGGEDIFLNNLSDVIFTKDSRKLYGRLPKDTLLTFDLKTKRKIKSEDIIRYDLVKIGKDEYLISLNTNGLLKLEPTNSVNIISFKHISNYVLNSKTGTIALIEAKNDSVQTQSITLLNINTLVRDPLFTGEQISNLKFDDDGKQIVFYAGNEGAKSIFYYNVNTKTTKSLVRDKDYDSKKYELSYRAPEFSLDGNNLFFYIRQIQSDFDSLRNKPLEIWNYNDTYLQSQLSADRSMLAYKKEYLFTVQLQNEKIIQLTKANQKICLTSINSRIGKYIILEDGYGNLDEPFISTSKVSYLLCKTEDGEIDTIISNRSSKVYEMTLSPNGKYAVYYDPLKQDYFSYSTSKKSMMNLTSSIKSSFLKFSTVDATIIYNLPAGLIGWTNNDEDLIIRTSYDLWLVNQDGLRAPLNLTQNIGGMNKIIFNSVINYGDKTINYSDKIYITGFNTVNKEFGFYSIYVKPNSNIKKLNTGSYCVGNPQAPYEYMTSEEFISNTQSDQFLVLIQSIDQAPNYFYTKDFSHFRKVSNQNPNEKYNWLTSELKNYQGPDGQNYSGILYKPEDFDENKKYPIIFSFYERQSDLLNSYPKVNPVMYGISNSMMTSNEYLVFLPDMQIGLGSVGEDALKSVLSAVEYLSKYKWVDTTNMGVSGHSFGGFEANYIIAHSNKFKAALSGSGNSEIISMAYDIWGSGGTSKQNYYMISAPKLNESLADNHEAYVKNSPLLNTKDITTPLLLAHNDNDMAVPFRQSRQLFISLRSQNKPVWLLNYRGESHVILQEKNWVDYNRKVFDFFNYYLKNKVRPQWMDQHN